MSYQFPGIGRAAHQPARQPTLPGILGFGSTTPTPERVQPRYYGSGGDGVRGGVGSAFYTSTAPGNGRRSLPACEYGSACYRTNPDHLREYSHPAAQLLPGRAVSLPTSSAADEDGGYQAWGPPVADAGERFLGISTSEHGRSRKQGDGQRAADKDVRRRVLHETLAAITDPVARAERHSVAQGNLERWTAAVRSLGGPRGKRTVVRVLPGDWGDVAGALTREFGAMFAVLNMANGSRFGGGYLEGCGAQEENMFRRTDCHFANEGVDRAGRYDWRTSNLVNGGHGRVFLDVDRPRLCVRGREEAGAPGLGYRWLGKSEVFPFLELRSAAQDLRGGRPFDRALCQRHVEAQLATLEAGGVRHVVLSAFGCGAFENPAAEVARCYRNALSRRLGSFDVVAFAIFNPGYGPDGNLEAFEKEFRDFGR